MYVNLIYIERHSRSTLAEWHWDLKGRFDAFSHLIPSRNDGVELNGAMYIVEYRRFSYDGPSMSIYITLRKI